MLHSPTFSARFYALAARPGWLAGAGLLLALAACQPEGKPRPPRRRPPKMPPAGIVTMEGTWLNALAENHGDTLVYRPNTYDFKPQPGRPGFSIRSYGRFEQYTPNPEAGLSSRPGTWHAEGPGRLRITFADGMVPATYTLSIVSFDSVRHVLEVRRLP